MRRRNTVPSQRDEEPLNEEVNHLEVGERSTQPPQKKTRGATKLNDVWKLPAGQKIQVEVNDDNQPIGKNVVTFAFFIGLIAKNSEYLPLSYDRWTKIPIATRARVVEVHKQKFDYPAVLDADWVNKSMSKKWRDYKVELKAKYYEENRTMVENTRVVPRGVVRSDWEILCHFWSTPEGKKRAERGRASRDAQDVLHTSGGTSFARRHAIMDVERGGADQYGDLDFFDATHMNSQGVFPSSKAATISRTARNRYAELSSASIAEFSRTPVDIVQLQHQVWVENMGPECHGRVRGKGLGPTPSRTCASSSTQPDPRDEKISILETQVANLQATVAHIAHIMRETNVQNSANIPRQVSTSKTKIYMVLEYVNGGELFDKIVRSLTSISSSGFYVLRNVFLLLDAVKL